MSDNYSLPPDPSSIPVPNASNFEWHNPYADEIEELEEIYEIDDSKSKKNTPPKSGVQTIHVLGGSLHGQELPLSYHIERYGLRVAKTGDVIPPDRYICASEAIEMESYTSIKVLDTINGAMVNLLVEGVMSRTPLFEQLMRKYGFRFT